MLQRAVEQTTDVLVPWLTEHLEEVPTIVFQDRIGQRNLEQFADFPFLQVVEELDFKVASQSVVEQNIVRSTKEQFLAVPMPLLKEQLVEVMFSVSQVKIRLVE